VLPNWEWTRTESEFAPTDLPAFRNSRENQLAMNPTVVLGDDLDREGGPHSRIEAPNVGGKMFREDDRIGGQREFSADTVFDFEFVSYVKIESHGTSEPGRAYHENFLGRLTPINRRSGRACGSAPLHRDASAARSEAPVVHFALFAICPSLRFKKKPPLPEQFGSLDLATARARPPHSSGSPKSAQ